MYKIKIFNYCIELQFSLKTTELHIVSANFFYFKIKIQSFLMKVIQNIFKFAFKILSLYRLFLKEVAYKSVMKEN